MGADFAYIGTRFIATEEANASEGYKDMIVEIQPTILCTLQLSQACMETT